MVIFPLLKYVSPIAEIATPQPNTVVPQSAGAPQPAGGEALTVTNTSPRAGEDAPVDPPKEISRPVSDDTCVASAVRFAVSVGEVEFVA